jgi:hypothetical protein
MLNAAVRSVVNAPRVRTIQATRSYAKKASPVTLKNHKVLLTALLLMPF